MRGLSGSDRGERQARVLVLNWRDVWHPEGGGSEVYVHEVAKRLVRDGIDVTVFTARYPGASRTHRADGISYVRRGGHLTLYLWAAWLLLTRRFGRLDAVLEVQNGMPFLAGLFTRSRVVVLVHHVHREQWPVIGPLLARVGWFMESKVAVFVNRRRRYLAVSDVTRSELVALGVAPGRIRLAYNGIPELPQPWSREESPTPRLVVLGRLVPHKQVEHAIALVARLAGDLPELRLDIVGSGWWQEQLRARVVAEGVEDRVVFWGRVGEPEKFQLLARAWLHVVPSLKEGWGLSIVEAGMVGVPSIAYWSAGGVRESIQDGVTGMLASSFEDMVERARWLIDDRSLRRGLGQKAALRTQQYSWDTTTATVRTALEL